MADVRGRPLFRAIQFTCKLCGQGVWINLDNREVIRNEFTGEFYSKQYGLCRWCFYNRGKPPSLTNRGA